MFIPVKTLEELQNDALERLKNTPISDPGHGSIVRLLLAAVNSVLAEYYERLGIVHYNSFVSTASGEFLDLLGDIVHCKRLPNEPDDEYRYRISQQALSDATANVTAIRLAALSVEGVKDVLIHEFALGTGSCALYVIADDPEQYDAIVESVRQNVEEVRACGVRVEVLKPKLIPVGLKIAVIFKGNANEMDKQYISTLIEQSAADYVNSLYPGQALIISNLQSTIATLIESDHNIADLVAEVRIFAMTRDGKEIDVGDLYCRWNERIVEDGAVGVRVI